MFCEDKVLSRSTLPKIMRQVNYFENYVSNARLNVYRLIYLIIILENKIIIAAQFFFKTANPMLVQLFRLHRYD